MTFRLNSETLDQFILESDRLGGPGTTECDAFWKDVLYEPQISLELQLEPRSQKYKLEQLALYREITGHGYLDHRDEISTQVPVDKLLNAPNAYDHSNPSDFVKHYMAMSILVQELQLPRGARILELGSGWGFTQEFLATCGYDTVGIEVNEDFIVSSNNRLKRLGFGERIHQGTFESFDTSNIGKFNAVISYEALHHAVDTEHIIRKYVSCLEPGGYFALAAEPFNTYYKTWGLRLDPYSIFSIKKYGWFESGWSVEYIAYLLGRCGMDAKFVQPGTNELTRYMIGRLSDERNPYQLGMWDPEIASGWWTGWDYCCSRGKSRFILSPPPGIGSVKFKVANFSGGPLRVSVTPDQQKEYSFLVKPGANELIVEFEPNSDFDDIIFYLNSETFCPAERGINADPRELGIHVQRIQWMPR